jgi:hypothetical protein
VVDLLLRLEFRSESCCSDLQDPILLLILSFHWFVYVGTNNCGFKVERIIDKF